MYHFKVLPNHFQKHHFAKLASTIRKEMAKHKDIDNILSDDWWYNEYGNAAIEKIIDDYLFDKIDYKELSATKLNWYISDQEYTLESMSKHLYFISNLFEKMEIKGSVGEIKDIYNAINEMTNIISNEKSKLNSIELMLSGSYLEYDI